MTTTLRVGTFNVYNTTARYSDRAPVLRAALHALEADVIGLQELVFGGGGQAEYLARCQAGHAVFDILEAPDFRIDGNAIALRAGRM